ncbi:hypothetical protein [Rickettsia endosymbiont of Orchestes rusci]|uniref:hypothetical protein n=1 Tax=Rickettsia endosymbiont of Orchestes rusci TaxID=3066250 RepID=UPI00313DF1C0
MSFPYPCMSFPPPPMSFPRRRESRKIYSHPEFISGSTKRDAANLFSMTKKSQDSRLRGNDIRGSGNDTESVFNHPRNNAFGRSQ